MKANALVRQESEDDRYAVDVNMFLVIVIRFTTINISKWFHISKLYLAL